ncbi:hypothetical protein D3C87_1845870 [compost metagenome]
MRRAEFQAVSGGHGHVVAAIAQRLHHVFRQVRFHIHHRALLHAEAGSVAHSLRILTERGQARDHLQMPLRLHGSAHHAE